MDACGRYVIGMYDPAYSADDMELISIIMQSLRCAISSGGSRINIIASHDAASRPCVLADLYRFGVYAECILGAIHGGSHILADIFRKSCHRCTAGIELSSADQVWQILLALMVQAIKEKIFTVEPERFGGYPECYDFEVGKLGTPQRGTFPSSFTRFPAKSCRFREFL